MAPFSSQTAECRVEETPKFAVLRSMGVMEDRRSLADDDDEDSEDEEMSPLKLRKKLQEDVGHSPSVHISKFYGFTS